MKFLFLLPMVVCAGCAVSTQGLTKDQIKSRESARDARLAFYAQVLSGVAVGLANTQGFKK